MKKIYFFLFILFVSAINAQVINFPDANFKAKLLAITPGSSYATNIYGQYTGVDLNNDGEIQQSEAAQIVKLDLSSGSSNSINNIEGINYFTNLKILNLNSNQLTSVSLNIATLEDLKLLYNNLNNLDVLNCTSLKKLALAYGNLTNINLQNLPLVELSILGGQNLNTLNLQGCNSLVNLTLLGGYGNQMTSLNLGNLASLKNVELNELSQLTNLNLQGSNNLFEIEISNTGLSSINVQNLNLLDKIIFTNNPTLQTVNFGNNTNLRYVHLPNNIISNLNVSSLSSLKQLTVQNNVLTSLNISNLNLLEMVICNNNLLNNISLQNTPLLKAFYFQNNNISNIDFDNSTLLNSIICSSNSLSNLDLSMLPNLTTIDCSVNNLVTLDFSHNPLLQSVQCYLNDNLTSINFKNGTSQAVNGNDFFPNPSLIFICCDDIEASYFYNYFQNYSPNTVLNSYCSFTPGGTFYTIQGNTRYDFDINGCSPTDTNKPHQKFNISGGGQSGSLISNSTGNYMIPVQAGNHTITPILENPTYWTISPSSFTANFPTQTSPLTQNFCISSNGTHNDLEVVIVPINAAAPGFTSKYKVIYKNKGTHTQSGNLSLSYNDNLMDFNSATTSPVTQSSGLLNWNFSNLLPFETREITVTYTLNTPTATPPLNGGDILNFNSLIIGATDETPSDNNFALNQTVVNSFDPNDKTCLEGSSIATTKVGDYVHYLVRFENTGTANAQNIVVKDLIDTTKFDLSSLVALNGSHSFITRITNPNTVEFIFENIQLPFANATNDGYVLFKIKTKSTLVLGDSFSNTANIYFDYNAPIVTNTYSTSVQNSLATDETEISNEFSIFPNPVSDFVSFKSPERIQKIEIFDLSGRIICANAVQNNSSDLSILSKGNYIIKAYSKQKTYIKKLIKK